MNRRNAIESLGALGFAVATQPLQTAHGQEIPIEEEIQPLPEEGVSTEALFEEFQQHTTGFVRVGIVSYYSRAGCIGCSRDFRMANGQPLNDFAHTLAFNELPLNRQVLVTNVDNGIAALATVTDTGGYYRHGYHPVYGRRIADLTIGLMNFLGAETDQTPIKIEEIIPGSL